MNPINNPLNQPAAPYRNEHEEGIKNPKSRVSTVVTVALVLISIIFAPLTFGASLLVGGLVYIALKKHYCNKTKTIDTTALSRLSSSQNGTKIMDPKTLSKAENGFQNTDADIYHTRVDSLHLDSARQSKIEAERPIEEDHSRIGKADEEDRFYKVAASPNVKNLPACGITQSQSSDHAVISSNTSVDAPKSFEERLEIWKNEDGLTENEQQGRQRAAQEILQTKKSSEPDQLLYLQGYSLSSLPSCIEELNNVIHINLSFNAFKTFPKELLKTSPLIIDLSHNQIKEIPQEVGCMVSLYKLDLQQNQIESIPPEVLGLPQLTVKMGTLQHLPSNYSIVFENLYWAPNEEEICQFSQELEEWVQKEPQERREQAAKEIVCAFKIGFQYGNERVTIRINQMGLSSLPECIKKLYFLNKIICNNNSLKENELDKISNLRRLNTLEAHSNQFARIPSSIKNLINLKDLNLRNNVISEVAPEIGELKKIETIKLSHNKIIKLPDSFWNCGKSKVAPNITDYRLKDLHLNNNPDLEVISEKDITDCENLEELRIEKNKLDQQGETLFEFQKTSFLQRLILS